MTVHTEVQVQAVRILFEPHDYNLEDLSTTIRSLQDLLLVLSLSADERERLNAAVHGNPLSVERPLVLRLLGRLGRRPLDMEYLSRGPRRRAALS